MKRALIVLTMALATAGFTRVTGVTHRAPYRVVFDLTSRDSLDQKAVMRWVREVTTSNPDAEVEVVMYGKGFELVLPERSTVLADVQALVQNPHVAFRVCAVALRNNGIAADRLVAGAQTVPDGIREIVERQQDDWGYIKVSH
jgi:uncharacterized protein